MTTLQQREEAFEKKFMHDEELRFKANARRNKLLGLWAAEKMGKTGDDAREYANQLVMLDFDGGKGDVFHRIRNDFTAAEVAQSDHQIHRTMDQLMATAIHQVWNGL